MNEATKAQFKELMQRFDALVVSQRFPPETQLMMLQLTRDHLFDWVLEFERAIAATRSPAAGGPVTKPVAALGQ